MTSDMEREHGIFLCLAAVLVGFGTLMVHSASLTSWPTAFEQVYLSRHLARVAIAVVLAWFCSRVSAQTWFRIAPYLFLFTLLLLVAVLIPGIGAKVNGARRWLRFGPISFQPSELAKITLPLLTCRLLVTQGNRIQFWWAATFPLLWPLALVVPLVILQPDLGTSLFLIVSCCLVLWVGGWPIRYFALGGFMLAPVMGLLVFLKPYQVKRITGFIATWTDINQAPYQLKQSLVSLGVGGPYGVGLGKGWQKLSFLPEANTDFVFAVVGEELGLLGTLGLIALWAGFYFAGLKLLRRVVENRFAYTVAFALMTQLVFQAALNMAVVTAIVPPKGIPHPFLSYGGSNLIVSIISVGIIVSLTRTDDAEFEDDN